jgi:hypothetical protein
MMAKHNKADPNLYAVPYYQRITIGNGGAVGGGNINLNLNGLNDPIALNGLDLDSGDEEEGTVVEEGNANTPRGARGRAGPSNANLDPGQMAPQLRPSSLPRILEPGSPLRSGTHNHHTHSADGRSSGLTTPGSGAELPRSASTEPELNGNGSGLARSAPAFLDGDSHMHSGPVAGPSRAVNGNGVRHNSAGELEEQAFAQRHIPSLPVPAFDEPVYNRHGRRAQKQREESDEDDEGLTNGNGEWSGNPTYPSKGSGVRRTIRNTLSDAGALLFGRGSSSASGSGGTQPGGGGGSAASSSGRNGGFRS